MNSNNVTETDADQPGPGVRIIINIPSSARSVHPNLNNVRPHKNTKYESWNRMDQWKYSPMR